MPAGGGTAHAWAAGRHASSVVLPFLLPDTPVVVWWPRTAPAVPAQDSLGRLAIRRITDATGAEDPLATLRTAHRLPRGHRPRLGSDHLLARAAGLRHQAAAVRSITSAVVSGLKDEPALDILAGWLASRIAARSGAR